MSICGVWHGVGVRTTEAFLARPLVFAANAPGAESEVYPNILNNLVGTKFKVVAGYPGVNDLLLALERGEADARCGWSWGAVKAARPDWLRDKKIYIAVQFATAKHPELPDVPLATDLARNDRERAALDLILTQQVMGRPFAAPPGVPAARVAALRHAFAQHHQRSRVPGRGRQAAARDQAGRRRGPAGHGRAHVPRRRRDVVAAARAAIGREIDATIRHTIR